MSYRPAEADELRDGSMGSVDRPQIVDLQARQLGPGQRECVTRAPLAA
jgi:hypothetical protein